MKTALVTSLGSVAGDIVIKNLKKMGFRVIGCDIYPKAWNVDASSVDVFYQSPLAADIPNYCSFIKDVCSRESVQYILPLTDVDVDVLNDHRSLLTDIGVTLCVSPASAISIIRNKKRLSDFIEKNCNYITTIPTLFLKDISHLPWQFPVVCKPFNGRSSQGRVYIHNQTEWQAFVSAADPEKYIAQPFVDGSVVVVEVIRPSDGRGSVSMAREELIRTPHGCGTTVKLFSDAVLENNSRQLADALGVTGCVNFEFIKGNDGQYHFIECNARFSAGVEFLCLAGYDYIKNHMRCFEGADIDRPIVTKPMIIARKYEEYITYIAD